MSSWSEKNKFGFPKIPGHNVNKPNTKQIGYVAYKGQSVSQCRSQWPRGLRCRSAGACLLKSWIRNPPGAWTFVCCECRVLSGRGLCDELITRPEESYRVWCVVACVLETSRIGAPYIYDISNLRVKIYNYDLKHFRFGTCDEIQDSIRVNYRLQHPVTRTLQNKNVPDRPTLSQCKLVSIKGLWTYENTRPCTDWWQCVIHLKCLDRFQEWISSFKTTKKKKLYKHVSGMSDSSVWLQGYIQQ